MRKRPPLPAFAPLIGALVLLAIGVVGVLYEEGLNRAQRDRATEEQAQILAASVAAALSFDDRAAAAEYVLPMQVNPEIAAVGIYRHDKRLLAGFARRGALSAIMPEGTRGDVVAPVAQHGTSLGWVVLTPRRQPLTERITHYMVLMLLAVMASIVAISVATAQKRQRVQAESLAMANVRLHEEISERAKVEEALRQSQKMEALGQLSGGLAHDLNNHLTIIKGNLYLLKRKLGLGDSDKHLAAANEGVARATALTQRVLGFSRKQALSPVKLNVNAVIAGMKVLLSNSLSEDIELRFELNATSPVVLDENQAENLILNLVINARDAMPDGGVIRIGTDEVSLDPKGEVPAGDYVRIRIQDNGSGMAPDIKARALDPFFTTKPVGQGTGLGLSNAFGFIAQSGGHLTLDSAPECGTTVSIYLPRQTNNAELV